MNVDRNALTARRGPDVPVVQLAQFIKVLIACRQFDWNGWELRDSTLPFGRPSLEFYFDVQTPEGAILARVYSEVLRKMLVSPEEVINEISWAHR